MGNHQLKEVQSAYWVCGVLGKFKFYILCCEKLEKTQTLKIPHQQHRKALAAISKSMVLTLAVCVLTFGSPGDLKVNAAIWISVSKSPILTYLQSTTTCLQLNFCFSFLFLLFLIPLVISICS